MRSDSPCLLSPAEGSSFFSQRIDQPHILLHPDPGHRTKTFFAQTRRSKSMWTTSSWVFLLRKLFALRFWHLWSRTGGREGGFTSGFGQTRNSHNSRWCTFTYEDTKKGVHPFPIEYGLQDKLADGVFKTHVSDAAARRFFKTAITDFLGEAVPKSFELGLHTWNGLASGSGPLRYHHATGVVDQADFRVRRKAHHRRRCRVLCQRGREPQKVSTDLSRSLEHRFGT